MDCESSDILPDYHEALADSDWNKRGSFITSEWF